MCFSQFKVNIIFRIFGFAYFHLTRFYLCRTFSFQALSEIPVSQVTKTFDLLKDEALGKQSHHPELGSDILENQTVQDVISSDKSESQAILDEIGGGLGDEDSGVQVE